MMSDLALFESTGHLGSDVPRCPECPVGVPSLFPSQNGTSRECPVSSCVVSRAPRSKGAGHGTGRTPALLQHGCGAYVLTGLDDDTAGLVVTCDPYPLTPIGEVEALRDDRRTYYLLHRRIERRDIWNIPGHLPSHDLLVIASHRCGLPVPDAWRLPPAPRPAPRPALEDF